MAFSEFLWKPLRFFYRLCLILKVLHQKPLSFFTLCINYEIIQVWFRLLYQSPISARFQQDIWHALWVKDESLELTLFTDIVVQFSHGAFFLPWKKNQEFKKSRKNLIQEWRLHHVDDCHNVVNGKLEQKLEKLPVLLEKIENFCNFHRKKFWEKIPL